MFSWECTNFLKQQKQSPEVFRKKGILKNFAIFTRKHLCLFGVFGVDFIKKRLQHKYLPVNIMKFLRTPIFKNIWGRLHLKQLFQRALVSRLYVIIKSRTSFRVNPHSIICLNVKELLA